MFLGRDLEDFTENELLLIADPELKPEHFDNEAAELDLFLQVNGIKYLKTRKAIARMYHTYVEASQDEFLTLKELMQIYSPTTGAASFYNFLKKYDIVLPPRAIKYRTGKDPLLAIIRRNDNVEDFLREFLSVKINNGYPSVEARYWFELFKNLEDFLADGSNEDALRNLVNINL